MKDENDPCIVDFKFKHLRGLYEDDCSDLISEPFFYVGEGNQKVAKIRGSLKSKRLQARLAFYIHKSIELSIHRDHFEKHGHTASMNFWCEDGKNLEFPIKGYDTDLRIDRIASWVSTMFSMEYRTDKTTPEEITNALKIIEIQAFA